MKLKAGTGEGRFGLETNKPSSVSENSGDSVPVTTAGPQVPLNSWSGGQVGWAYPVLALQEAVGDSFSLSLPPSRTVPAQ